MLLPYLREQKMKPKVNEEIEFYKKHSGTFMLDKQLEMFNVLWEDIQLNVPYYKNLVDRSELPQNITNMDDFRGLPILDREFATKHTEELTNHKKAPDLWSSTGGSTGNPFQFPKWNSENNYYEPAIWYVRSFYGIKRSDKMFRLWGHSHTMGSGLSRYKNILKFKIGLPLIGFKRFSAYDLSTEKLRIAGEEILKFKPKYIIAYSKALNMLARANEDRKDEFHKLNLKAVMGAAEGFEKPSDKDYISNVFGCPVASQYASMETNYIAHTHPNGGFKALWKNNLIECVDEAGNPAQTGRLLVTSLYPRAFPLIRYELGDILENVDHNDGSVYSFDRVKGRDNDFLMLDKDTPIHSEGISHAIKYSDKIIAYQIKYDNEYNYTIYIKAKASLNNKDISEIRDRLALVDLRLKKLPIKEVDKLEQTIAGKTKWLIKEE